MPEEKFSPAEISKRMQTLRTCKQQERKMGRKPWKTHRKNKALAF